MDVATLIDLLIELAPELATTGSVNIAPEQRNVALQRVGVCVDPTEYTIGSALKKGVQVLVSYHPWYGEAKSLMSGKDLVFLPLHTAWDNAPEGVNMTFAGEIGLNGIRLQENVVVGNTDLELRGLLERCQRAVDQNIIPYAGELRAKVKQVGIWAGPGFSPYNKKVWEAFRAAGCDTIISGELSIVPLRYAAAHKMQLIDLGHSLLAKPAMARLVKVIKERLEVVVEFFADCYGCNYYTNFYYSQQQDSEDFLKLFTHR